MPSMKMEANGGSPQRGEADGGGLEKCNSIEPEARPEKCEALREAEDRLPKGLLERYTLQEIVLTIRGQVQCIRAVEDKTGATVLLKSSLTPTGAQILNREGEMMDEVDIMNTLEVLDDPGHHLVVEWPEKGNLEHLLQRGPLELHEVRDIAGDIFKALNDLHQNGYVHEDVRPVHVWLADDGAKLAGYGLRRATESTSARHLAPELRYDDGDFPVHSVDMWAMGVLILEMLTGKHVISEDEEDRNRMHRRMKDPSKLAAFISDQLQELEEDDEGEMIALERLLTRLLSHTPSKRSTARGALQSEFISPDMYRKSRRGGRRKRKSRRNRVDDDDSRERKRMALPRNGDRNGTYRNISLNRSSDKDKIRLV